MRTILTRACIMALLALASIGCLSYNYSGLTDEKQLPTAAVVGMTYDQVVARFGAPSRIVSPSRGSSGEGGKAMESEAGGSEARLGRRLLVYRRSAAYQILLYQRQRASEFVLTLEAGRVVAFQSSLTRKADGISISLMPLGEGPGGQAGAAAGGPQAR